MTMKEKTLLMLALLGAISGIIVLYSATENISVEERVIEKITDGDIGKDLRVVGEVVKVTDRDKVAFLKIEQNKPVAIDIVLFKNMDIDISEGEYVEIMGKVDDYDGKIQIVANEVKKLG